MIDLYYWATPNGNKILLFLEEAGLPYTLHSVDIGKGKQFESEFLKISPNNRIPAIVDHNPKDGGAPISIFESGAILVYLAEKTGRFLPSEIRERNQVTQWLFWQVGGLGPMAGQNHHFHFFAQEKIIYARERFRKETSRLYGVLDKHLEGRTFMAQEYSIADMAIYPWVISEEREGQDINTFLNLKHWIEIVEKRPATQRTYQVGDKCES